MSEKDFDVVQMRTELHEMPELGFHEEKLQNMLLISSKSLVLTRRQELAEPVSSPILTELNLVLQSW